MNGTGVDHPGTLRSRSVTWESPHLTLSQTRFGYFLTGPYELLAPVYAWFTEGFDTKDLLDAKALLDELA